MGFLLILSPSYTEPGETLNKAPPTRALHL